MYYCIECGKANPERARFCAFCGAKLFTGSLETDEDGPQTETAAEAEKPEGEKPFSIADIFPAPAMPVSGEAPGAEEASAVITENAAQEEPAPAEAQTSAGAETPTAPEKPVIPEKPVVPEKPARETVQPKAENPAQPKPEWAKTPAQPAQPARPTPQPVREAVKAPVPQPVPEPEKEPEEEPKPAVRTYAPAAQEKPLYDDDFDLDAPEEPEQSAFGRLGGFLQKMRILHVEEDLWEEAEQETEEDDLDPYGDDDDEDGDNGAFDADEIFDGDDPDDPGQERHGMGRALGRLLKKEPETVVTSSGVQELPPRRPLGREGRDTHVPKRILTPEQKEQKMFLSEDEPDSGDIYDDDEDERYVQQSVAKILLGIVLVLVLSAGLWIGCTASGQVFLAGFGLSRNADAYRTLGDRARAANQIKRAAEAYYTALSLDPDDYETALWVGITRQQIGDYETAANAYYKCTTLDPARSDAYVYLVKLYQAQGDGAAESYWRELGKKNTGLDSLGV